MEDRQRIAALQREGFSCSQIMVQMALDRQGSENPELVLAVKGLSCGMKVMANCGILTGAACVVPLFDQSNIGTTIFTEFLSWFEENYARKKGGIDCRDLLNGDLANRPARCPNMVAQSWFALAGILDEHGF